MHYVYLEYQKKDFLRLKAICHFGSSSFLYHKICLVSLQKRYTELPEVEKRNIWLWSPVIRETKLNLINFDPTLLLQTILGAFKTGKIQ